ncbi:MAG: hypothetical protein AB7F35_02010 [Acetobacteraceae bacterium]
MAILLLDGFEKYGEPNYLSGNVNLPALHNVMAAVDGWSYAGWTGQAQNVLNLVPGLLGRGTALRFSPSNSSLSGTPWYLKKAVTASSRVLGGLRGRINMLSAFTYGLVITLFKGVSAQCTIVVNTAGTISLKTGSHAGTVLDTSSATVVESQNFYLEWDITIGAAAAYTVYLNGIAILSGTGNTRGDGVNASADGLGIGHLNTISGTVSTHSSVDDLYLFDSTGSVNNAVLLNDPVVETLFPIADSATGFTMGSGVIGHQYPGGPAMTVSSPSGNRLVLRKVTPPVSCTLDRLVVLPGATAASAKFKAVLYNDSAGVPSGAAVATGTEVVGTTSGIYLALPFAAGQALTGGTQYWIGYITDTSVNMYASDGLLQGYSAANTYAAGAPSSPSMTSGQASWLVCGIVSGVSGANYAQVGGVVDINDGSYNAAATVGQEDLFHMGTLSAGAATIYAAVVRATGRKTDGGSRTVDLEISASGTIGTGSASGLSPMTSYGGLTSVFETDPATGSAWTVSAVNAVLAGVKIAS